MDSIFTAALTFLRLTSSGSRLAADMAWRELYGVQNGNPIKNAGLSFSNFRLALVRISPSSKFHALPSPSHVVRSNAKPAMTFELGIILMAAVARGGLYISDTTALIAFDRSFL